MYKFRKFKLLTSVVCSLSIFTQVITISKVAIDSAGRKEEAEKKVQIVMTELVKRMPSEELQESLFVAVANGDVDYVQKLIMWGVSINIQNSQGETPLHVAVKRDDSIMINILLGAGANPKYFG